MKNPTLTFEVQFEGFETMVDCIIEDIADKAATSVEEYNDLYKKLYTEKVKSALEEQLKSFFNDDHRYFIDGFEVY